jgi:hypothetical protein
MLCLQGRQQKRQGTESWQKSEAKKWFLPILGGTKGIKGPRFCRDQPEKIGQLIVERALRESQRRNICSRVPVSISWSKWGPW